MAGVSFDYIMNKNLIIIPGFGETTRQPSYRQIAIFAREKGFNVLVFNPKWQRRVATDWINEFKQFIKRHAPLSRNTVVLGFSFGAYIAINATQNIKFKKLLLCSLSPYFRDDITKLPALAYKILGARRMKDFRKYAFPSVSQEPAVFFVGDKDLSMVVERTKKSYKQWHSPKKLEIVRGAEHVIDKKYLERIKRYI